MRRPLFVVAALLALTATSVHAQITPELRPFAGVYIPTGDQRDVLKDAMLIGGQVALEMSQMAHLVGTLAYTTTQPEGHAIGNDVHIFHYNLGAELFRVVPMRNEWMFRPFVGAGIGARTHDFYDRDDTDAETYFAGYGAVGAEFQVARIAVRLEARDYVSRFKGLMGHERASAQNAVMLGAGLALHLR